MTDMDLLTTSVYYPSCFFDNFVFKCGSSLRVRNGAIGMIGYIPVYLELENCEKMHPDVEINEMNIHLRRDDQDEDTDSS